MNIKYQYFDDFILFNYIYILIIYLITLGEVFTLFYNYVSYFYNSSN